MKLNVKLLQKYCDEEEQKAKYETFISAIDEIIELKAYTEVPKYKLLGVIEITPALRNRVVTSFTTVATALAYSFATS